MGAVTERTGLVEWAVAVQPIDGERACGDQHLVAPFAGGVLIAVIDGAGHGPLAEEAAKRAVSALQIRPGLPVEELILLAHASLRESRGAVMSLLSVGAGGSQWIGVGDVEGKVLRAGGAAPEWLSVRGGIVGQNLPILHPTPIRITPDDTVILHTDGIRWGVDRQVEQTVARTLPVAALADAILAGNRRGTDDALVLVARLRAI